MDAKTEELRAAHDVLAEIYADRLADALERMPVDRAVLGLVCEVVLDAGLGAEVGDVGCGTGRLEPYLPARGRSRTPHWRAWCAGTPLLFLDPADRPVAFGELARVVKPGGHVVTAFEAGDGQRRRAGRRIGLGVEFDTYWLSPQEMERRVADAGFTPVFWGRRPPEEDEASKQGYPIARRR